VQEHENGELAGVEAPPVGALAERFAQGGQHAFFVESAVALAAFIDYTFQHK
jgi:hypothetical protein